MKTTKLLSLGATGLGVALAAGITSASAQEDVATTAADTEVAIEQSGEFNHEFRKGMRGNKSQLTEEEREAHKAETVAIIAANDYDAWVELHEARKAEKLANMPEDMEISEDRQAHMDEKFAERTSQENFEELVAVYQADGEDGLDTLRQEKRAEHKANGHGMRGNR